MSSLKRSHSSASNLNQKTGISTYEQSDKKSKDLKRKIFTPYNTEQSKSSMHPTYIN